MYIIPKIVNKIQANVLRQNIFDNSIFENIGIILLLLENKNTSADQFDKIIDGFSEAINKQLEKEKKLSTFGQGLISYAIAYRYLVKKRLITIDPLFENMIQNICVESGAQLLSMRNYDFLYGATGIIHYLLDEDNLEQKSIDLIYAYIESLYNNRISTIHGKIWEDIYYNERISETKVNLGLAHGVPAILKQLVTIKKKYPNIHSKKVADMINESCQFLINIANPISNTHSVYPNYFICNSNIRESSRLSWCYGDVSIGITLFQVAHFLKNNKLLEFALNVMLSCVARFNDSVTGIKDSGLCHGSSGVAHIYNKMWLYTNDTVFKNAADYWIRKTISFIHYGDETSCFKKYNPIAKSFETDFGLLEGETGVGLALLSYINGNTNWDYCLMLNDI